MVTKESVQTNPYNVDYWSKMCVCGSSRAWHGEARDRDTVAKCTRQHCRCKGTCTGFRQVLA